MAHSSAGHYGADRQLALLCRTLDRERVTPTVLLPFAGELAADLDAEVVTGPVPVLRRETLNPGGLRRLGASARATRAWIARRRFDVVHANTSVIVGLRAPRLTVSVREIYPRIPALWPLYRRWLSRADALACVSAATRSALGIAGSQVVYDGLDPAVSDRPLPTRAAARAALGLPADGVLAAVLGRLSPWKGQALLLEAAAAVPDLRVLVAGDAWPGATAAAGAASPGATAATDGTGAAPATTPSPALMGVTAYEHELRALAAPIRARVAFTPFRHDVETIYAAADIVVVPSTSPDPLPNTALEAAAAGRVVVAAAHGGLPEIITDGVTGRLFPPGDARALAAVLRELQSEPAQRERLRSAAAADVRARFPADGPARALTALWLD